jgi:hypothetical protein
VADEPKAPPFTPAARPKDREISGPPMAVFVKGGTTTLKWDLEQQRSHAEAEARRAKQDRMYDAVAGADEHTKASVHSHDMGGLEKPVVVLELMFARDKSKVQYMICELNEEYQPDGQVRMCLMMFCPKCIFSRGRRPEHSIIRIDPANREFWLDEKKKGQVFVDPDDGQSYLIAGTITTRDVCSCPHLGCDWRFRIDDSELHTISGHYTP